MDIYKELLTNHYRNPRNRGSIPGASFTSKMHNPSCGDSICFQGIIKDNFLIAVAFQGSGCVISQATASLLTEVLQGKSLGDILAFGIGDVLELIGMQLGPVRIKCAALPLQAIHAALESPTIAEGRHAQLCEIVKSDPTSLL